MGTGDVTVRWLERLRLPRERCVLRHLLAVAGCGEDFAGWEVGQRHVDHEALPGGGWTSQCCCRWCDACAGAERERAALVEEVGLGTAAWDGWDGPVVVAWPGPTPPTWRCRP